MSRTVLTALKLVNSVCESVLLTFCDARPCCVNPPCAGSRTKVSDAGATRSGEAAERSTGSTVIAVRPSKVKQTLENAARDTHAVVSEETRPTATKMCYSKKEPEDGRRDATDRAFRTCPASSQLALESNGERDRKVDDRVVKYFNAQYIGGAKPALGETTISALMCLCSSPRRGTDVSLRRSEPCAGGANYDHLAQTRREPCLCGVLLLAGSW